MPASKKTPIHWPATDQELIAAGYQMPPGAAVKCKGRTCTAWIEFWRTPGGKSMPLHRLEDKTLQPHFADCPDVPRFRA